MAGMTQQDIVLKPKKPFDPVATFTRHWFKIVVFGGSLFILLSPFALLLSKTYHKVSGKLVVLPESESMISRTDEGSVASYYHQFISTQLDIIKSPQILEKAINRLPADNKKYFMPKGMSLSFAARLLNRELTVEQPSGTHFIDVTLERDDAKGMVEMVNTIMEVYIEDYEKGEEGKDYRRLSFLQSEKENLNSEIEIKSAQLKKISEEIASSAFSGNDDEAAQFEMAYENSYRDRVEKEKKLKAIKGEAETLKKLSLDAYIQELISKNTVVSKLDVLAQESLHKLRDSQVGLSEDNPGRHQLEERIKDIKEYTTEQKDIIKEDIKKLLYEKRETELREKIIHAETDLNAAKMIEDEILKKRNQLLEKRAEITAKELNRKQIESGLEQMKNNLNRVDTRFYELKLESKAPGKIRLERLADNISMISGSNLKKLIVLIFLFAFGLISGTCLLFDILDDRIRGEKDILNSLGALPHRPVSDYLQVRLKKTSFSRVLLDDPTNKVAQSIHSLAIKLDKERKGHNAKIAVFTGVDSKSGVTEILLNTAYAMSKLCSKILIIETNFAHPSLKNLIRTNENKKGLLDLIEGQASLSDCITLDKERGIDVILAGHLPSDDELVNLDRSKISILLEKVRENYDFILIDTMPMLISDLAEFLIVQADIVPLVVQGDRSLYKFTYMAGQSLFKLEVPAIAAVLNLGAPRYRTKIQEIVFRLLWPVQAWIKTSFLRSLHPTPDQPYPSYRISGAHFEKIGISLKQFFKKTTNHRAIINACKSIFILYIFIQITLLMTFMSSTANVNIHDSNSVRQKIIIPSKIHIGLPNGKKPLKQHDRIAAPIDTGSLLPRHDTELTKNEPAAVLNKQERNNDNKFIKDENWILKQDPDLYTIQLVSVGDKEELMQFARAHGIENMAACYHKLYNGRSWYSLIYGVYSGHSKAVNSLKHLPDQLNISSPWIQKIGSIQDIINKRNSDSVKAIRVD